MKITLIITACLFVVLAAFVADALSGRAFEQFDPELGWHFNNRIAYGSSPSKNPDLICSGDSFTWGSGVKKNESWCALIAGKYKLALNLANPGYGIDQMYLIYRRMRRPAKLHILAYIDLDLFRMRSGFFNCQARPQLDVEQGQVVHLNRPLRSSELKKNLCLAWFNTVHGSLNEYNFKEYKKFSLNEKQRRLIHTIFAELKEDIEQHGGRFLVVRLPQREWYRNDIGVYIPIREIAAELQIDYLDLQDRFNALPQSDFAAMFLPAGPPDYSHPSARGHALFAREINNYLNKISKDFALR